VIVVVADASPLIALERIGHLELLKALFGEVLVPPAVAAEALDATQRARKAFLAAFGAQGPVGSAEDLSEARAQ
jgi:predicted nucleic acid-binding protein